MTRNRFNQMRWSRGLAACGVLCGVALVGCDSVSKVFSGGDTQTVMAATADRVGPIAADVVRDMGLTDVQATVTQLDAVVTGYTAEGNEVTVTVTPAGASTARVAVSNQAGPVVAERLLREIEARLNEGASATPAVRYVQRDAIGEQLVKDADDGPTKGDTPPNPFD